jgi:hypothetical protein
VFNTYPNTFNGLKITFSDHAMEDTEVRNFPTSRHRSKRIYKKLIKRFGSEFKKVPCMYQTRYGIIAHPSMRRRIEDALRKEL